MTRFDARPAYLSYLFAVDRSLVGSAFHRIYGPVAWKKVPSIRPQQ